MGNKSRADFGSVYGSRSIQKGCSARRGAQLRVVPRPAARNNAGGRFSELRDPYHGPDCGNVGHIGKAGIKAH
jgi:hypothetical protein